MLYYCCCYTQFCIISEFSTPSLVRPDQPLTLLLLLLLQQTIILKIYSIQFIFTFILFSFLFYFIFIFLYISVPCVRLYNNNNNIYADERDCSVSVYSCALIKTETAFLLIHSHNHIRHTKVQLLTEAIYNRKMCTAFQHIIAICHTFIIHIL